MSDEQNTEGQAPDVTGVDALLKIANASNIDDAVKWAENANSYMGRSIQLPTEPSAEANRLINDKLTAHGLDVMLKPDLNDPEQLMQLKKMMGVPDELDGYQLPEASDELQYNVEEAERFKNIAHKYGLPQDAFQGIVQDMASQSMSQKAEMLQQRESQMAELKGKLGYAYDEKVAEATALMKIVNPDYNADNASPREIEGMLNIAQHFKALGSEGNNFTRPAEQARRTPDEAKAEIAKLRTNEAYLDPAHPEHAMVKKQMSKLYAELFPENGVDADGTVRVGGVQFK